MEIILLLLGAVTALFGRILGGLLLGLWKRRDEFGRSEYISALLGDHYLYRLHTTGIDYVEVKLSLYKHLLMGYKFKWHPIGINGENKPSNIVFYGPIRFVENRVILKGDDFIICILDAPFDATNEMRVGNFGGVRHHGKLLYGGIIILSRSRILNKEFIIGLLNSSDQDAIFFLSEEKINRMQVFSLNNYRDQKTSNEDLKIK